MEKRVILILVILSLVVILSIPVLIYLHKEEKNKEKAISICIETCRQEIIRGKDLSNGPCLLDPIKELPNWVCDVVNVPRQEIDNLQENQCYSYIKGKSKRFVEVSTNCQFVRTN